MHKRLVSVSALIVVCVAAWQVQAAEFNLQAYMQEASVMVRGPGGSGSGFVFHAKNGHVYVWTAAHVVDGARQVEEVDGKKLVTFADVKVALPVTKDGRIVGLIVSEAQIIRYSDFDRGEDLALLRLRYPEPFKTSVKFYLDKKLPELGTDVFHCGSLLGEINSVLKGVLAQHGRVHGGKLYDQLNISAFPGSSGGGVFLPKDGSVVGMVTRGREGGFVLMVPARRIVEWAKKAKVAWAVDATVPCPSEEELEKLPVEN